MSSSYMAKEVVLGLALVSDEVRLEILFVVVDLWRVAVVYSNNRRIMRLSLLLMFLTTRGRERNRLVSSECEALVVRRAETQIAPAAARCIYCLGFGCGSPHHHARSLPPWALRAITTHNEWRWLLASAAASAAAADNTVLFGGSCTTVAGCTSHAQRQLHELLLCRSLREVLQSLVPHEVLLALRRARRTL